MNKSKRLETIFHNGEPDGIRTCRKYMSTITCYVIPRALINTAKSLTGINNPGIYFLINEEEGKLVQVYIGQTRNGIARIDDHKSSKDFWNKAIMFLADIQHFSLNIIGGLETYAITQAAESKRYQVENKMTPQYKIPEFDLPIIEDIYEEIEFVMATLGYKLYRNVDANDEPIYRTSRRGIIAYGKYSGEKFELMPGSQIDISKKVNLESYNTMRKTLIDGQGINLKDGKYYLDVILEFKTPSGASDFVLGGSTNGWLEWKDSTGKTLDEIFRNTDTSE